MDNVNNIGAHPLFPTSRRELLMNRIAAYMDAHLEEKITLEGVAQYCGVSISTITQMFQKKTDTTFHHYLTRHRMFAAEQLIRSGTPLEHIGKQLGYRDHSTFYRAFRRNFGISPQRIQEAALSGSSFAGKCTVGA